MTRQKVTASGENFGEIPIIKGEENSEKVQSQMEEKTQKKFVSENRETLLKGVIKHSK